MCCIASTTGTTLCFVMSKCSIVRSRYCRLLLFCVATMHLLLGESNSQIKSHRGPLRCVTIDRDTRHCGPGWLCCFSLSKNDLRYYYAAVKRRFTPTKTPAAWDVAG